MNKVANAVASQLVWLIAVGGAARGFGWAGPVAVCVFAALQMYGYGESLVKHSVIPANAGIHFDLGPSKQSRIKMDSSLRWNDGRAFATACRKDLYAIAACVAIGFLCDSAFATTGLVRYASPGPWPHLAPLWIVALWASFGLTLHHSLSFLQSRLWLAAALGALFGPLSYYAAARAWQAIELAQPITTTLTIIALAWAIAMPLLLLIARQHSASRLQLQSPEFSP